MKSYEIYALRGLTIALLVFYHVVGSDPVSGLMVQDGPLRYINNILSVVRMPLITALAGYVYAVYPHHPKQGLLAFISKKARRLLIPMLVVGTFFVFVREYSSVSQHKIENIYMLHILPVAHYWYVEALFWNLVLISLMDHYGFLKSYIRLYIFMVLVALLHFYTRLPSYFGLFQAVYLMPYFLFGVLCFRLRIHHVARQPTIRFFLLVGILTAFYIIGDPGYYPERNTLVFMLGGFMAIGVLMSIRIQSKLLSVIGKAAFSIYLFHVFFTAATRGLLVKIGIPVANNLVLHTLLGCICGIIGPLLLYYLLRKIPVLRTLLFGEPYTKTTKSSRIQRTWIESKNSTISIFPEQVFNYSSMKFKTPPLRFPVYRAATTEGAEAECQLHGMNFPFIPDLEPYRTNEEKVIALANMVIFHRLLQKEDLQVIVRDVRGDRFFSVHLDPTASLGACYAAIEVSKQQVDNFEVIDLLIRWDQATYIPCKDTGCSWVLDVTKTADGMQSVLFADTSNYNDAASLTLAFSSQDYLQKLAITVAAIQQEPDTPLAALSLVTHTSESLLANLKQPIIPVDFEPIAATIDAVALKQWDSVAIDGPSHSYTYGQLYTESMAISESLLNAGVQAGQIVAIVTAQSAFGALAGMLAVLRNRSVLVFLDTALPQDRIDAMVHVCAPVFTIHCDDTTDAVPDIPALNIPAWPDLQAVDRSADINPIVQAPIAPHEAAYVFFTSGSTGEPKGVLGSQLGLAHFLNWQRSTFPINASTRHAQLTALTFDVVLRDILYPLSSGAMLVIPERSMILDPVKIMDWFKEQRINSMHCVPSVMKAWLRAPGTDKPLESLNQIFFAGEPLIDSLIAQVKELGKPTLQLANFYGPTETTLAKLCNIVTQPEKGVQPVGKPQPGVDVFIVRDRQYQCGLWEVGEIAIRTPYRSEGYYHQPELTDQVFIANPHRTDPDDLIYYTGDLGRIRPDGKIEIFGRIDAQIKINGVRIESTEIEAALIQHPSVLDAAVTVRVNDEGEKCLWAVIALDPAHPLLPTQVAFSIRQELQKKLPSAMIPRQFHCVDALPYLPNGKVNRKAISQMTLIPQEISSSSKHTDLESESKKLIEDLENVIALPIDSLDMSFNQLGADSLSFIKAALLIEESLGYAPNNWEKLPLKELLALKSSPQGAQKTHLFSRIDTSIILRVVAISFVIISHTGREFLSATSLLFILSGFALGRFFVPTILRTKSIIVPLKFVAKFAIPAGIYQLLRAIYTGEFWIPDLILLGTIFQNPDTPHYTYWFLDILGSCILQISLVIMLYAKFIPDRYKTDFTFQSGVLATLICILIALTQEHLNIWNGNVGYASVAPFKWLWLLTLGWTIYLSKNSKEKIFSSILVIVIFSHKFIEWIPQNLGFYNSIHYVDTIMLIFLIWVREVPVPTFIKPMIVNIAMATLFIYLINWPFLVYVYPKTNLPDWIWLELIMTLGLGYLFYRIWDAMTATLSKLLSSKG